MANLQEALNIGDPDQARQLLESANWDVSLAVETYLQLTSDEPTPPPPQQQTSQGGLRQRRPQQQEPQDSLQQDAQADNGAQPAEGQQADGWWWRWVLSVTTAPFRYLLGPLVDFFWGFFVSLVPVDLLMDADKPGHLQEKLVAMFEAAPDFHNTGLNEALSHAKRELKFMLIYIHHPDHPDTERLCQETICDEEVITFINSNVIFWGESVRCRQGRQVARSLRAHGRPLMALVSLLQGQMRVVYRHLGYITKEDFLSQIVINMEQFQPALVAEQQERQQRATDQLIREEQDKAFEDSLKRDQEKMRLKEEQKRKEEEALREAERQELEEKRKVEERKSRLVEKQSSLPLEPSKDDKVTRIKIRFPDGTVKDRLFSPSDPLEALFDFVDVQDLVAEDFSLFSGHPKKLIEPRNCTFEEAGLSPRALINVQDNTV